MQPVDLLHQRRRRRGGCALQPELDAERLAGEARLAQRNFRAGIGAAARSARVRGASRVSM
jgi:hypothetical protein